MRTSADSRSAWVVAVNMGYGHQRTADPLRELSPLGQVVLANDYPDMPDTDRALWDRTRRFYEFISNIQRIPLVGEPLFRAFDLVQRILTFYPRRDLSRPDSNVRMIYSLIRKGWGGHLIERLAQTSPIFPIVTSFYAPAFMAEFFEYPGDIYCVICDSDIARAWAALNPGASRIRYFAPDDRVVERLALYGVPRENIIETGYPLPMELIGDERMGVLIGDMGRRMANLDPERRYLDKYGVLVREKLGDLPGQAGRPLSVLFSIGGAGAQKEIIATALGSLRAKIASGELRVIISAGIKPWVRDYLAAAVQDLKLADLLGGGVEIIYEETIDAYFRRFNVALKTTDILWTKPSELSFYTALGFPVIMAPPIGSQEHSNREWLLRLGSGIPQEDPRYAGEWLFDLVRGGWCADAAMQGFIEAPKLGAWNIQRAILFGASSSH